MSNNVDAMDATRTKSPSHETGTDESGIDKIRKRFYRQPNIILQLISITLYMLAIIFAFKLIRILLLPSPSPVINEFVIILSSCLAVNIAATIILSQYQSVLKNLEKQVDLKTASLSQANQCLRIEIAEHQEAKVFLESLLDNSADPIGIVDQHGRFTKWNKAAEEIYGFTRDEMKREHFSNFYADEKQLKLMLSQLRRHGFVKKYEINMKKKNGSIALFAVSIRKLYGKNNKIIGSICIARDL
jgi:PAS domain S-box-containing protein